MAPASCTPFGAGGLSQTASRPGALMVIEVPELSADVRATQREEMSQEEGRVPEANVFSSLGSAPSSRWTAGAIGETQQNPKCCTEGSPHPGRKPWPSEIHRVVCRPEPLEREKRQRL